MSKIKKRLSTDNLLNKLETIRIVLESNLSAIETLCEKSDSQKRAIKQTNKGMAIVDDILDIISEHGYEPSLDELCKLVTRSILANRLLVRDPNRIRNAEPVIYSSINPEFPFDATIIDPGKQAVLINIRHSRGGAADGSKKSSTVRRALIPKDSEV